MKQRQTRGGRLAATVITSEDVRMKNTEVTGHFRTGAMPTRAPTDNAIMETIAARVGMCVTAGDALMPMRAVTRALFVRSIGARMSMAPN